MIWESFIVSLLSCGRRILRPIRRQAEEKLTGKMKMFFIELKNGSGDPSPVEHILKTHSRSEKERKGKGIVYYIIRYVHA